MRRGLSDREIAQRAAGMLAWRTRGPLENGGFLSAHGADTKKIGSGLYLAAISGKKACKDDIMKEAGATPSRMMVAEIVGLPILLPVDAKSAWQLTAYEELRFSFQENGGKRQSVGTVRQPDIWRSDERWKGMVLDGGFAIKSLFCNDAQLEFRAGKQVRGVRFSYEVTINRESSEVDKIELSTEEGAYDVKDHVLTVIAQRKDFRSASLTAMIRIGERLFHFFPSGALDHRYSQVPSHLRAGPDFRAMSESLEKGSEGARPPTVLEVALAVENPAYGPGRRMDILRTANNLIKAALGGDFKRLSGFKAVVFGEATH